MLLNTQMLSPYKSSHIIGWSDIETWSIIYWEAITVSGPFTASPLGLKIIWITN